MITVTGFVKERNKNILRMENENGDTLLQVLQDGMLESYMGVWDLSAGACLTALISDAAFEWFDPPLMGDQERMEEFYRDMDRAGEEIAWGIDRDETLAAITLADDDAELVRSTWAARTALIVEQGVPEPPTMVERLRAQKELEDAYAASHQRLQEERLADEFVSELPHHLRGAPKADSGTAGLPLAIQIVD